jgi:hypothetical protein
MITNNKVNIVLNSSNINRYRDLGYIGDIKEEIEIDILHLSKGSHALIDVKCDICGNENRIKYNQMIKYCYTDHYFCKKCKNKNTLLEKYGVINVFQLNEIKEKIKITNIEKYGVDNPSKNETIKNKKKETSIKNYGVEQSLSSQIIKNKSKNTLLEKYGIDNISKVDYIKRKKEITCLKNNGVKYISQSDDFKKRIKKNILMFLKNKYGVIDYEGDNYTFYCDKCDKNYIINKRAYQTRRELHVEFCTQCNPIGSFSISGEEKKMNEFIIENYIGKVITNSKNIISPLELDICLPDLKLAFEFNGLYWHSELYKETNYHLNKTEECESDGIKLIHIYEDDWMFKQDIVKSRILNLLGKSEKIFARKCIIKEIDDNKIIREFLEKNHLQGFIGSLVKIGLFYNEELVSLMTFGSQRKPMGQKSIEGTYELLRFCNKLNTNVVGGASRLFKYFIKNYNPKEVISYADRSWSAGNLYEKMGFKLVHKTQPNYYYIIDGIRKHRFNYRKDKLIREGNDPNKTEHEIMLEKKIFRIYDSGSLKYVYELENKP